MKRKVIQIADSTQLISLPRKWCVSHGIKKGDELDVAEDNNQLIVSTQSEAPSKKCTIDLTQLSKLKRRSICAAYLKGYDEVEIIYDKPEYIRVIQSVLPEFTGYDIVKQEKNSCIVKQISKPTAEEFENVFNRLFLLLSDTLQTTIEALKTNDFETLKGIPFREVNINKFSNFCRRLVNKGGYSAAENNTSIYFILMSLEFLGDEYKTLAEYFLDNKMANKQYISILEKIYQLYDNSYRVFKTKNRAKAAENALFHDKLLEEIKEYMTKNKADPVIYSLTNKIVQIIIQMQEAMLLLTV